VAVIAQQRAERQNRARVCANNPHPTATIARNADHVFHFLLTNELIVGRTTYNT
jgi:hypothetical protein